MTTYQLPLNSETIHMPETKSGEQNSRRLIKDAKSQLTTNDRPLALIVLGYFLGLASIAVVVVGGQFPWFTLAPATILLLVAYFRHLEASFERESSR